jgi:hypothetical protein
MPDPNANTAQRCERCDREDCPTFAARGTTPARWSAAELDCQRHAVDWRARAKAGEKLLECWKENAHGINAELKELRDRKWNEANTEKLEKLARLRERTEQDTVRRVAAWLESLCPKSRRGLGFMHDVERLAAEVRSGAWKEGA